MATYFFVIIHNFTVDYQNSHFTSLTTVIIKKRLFMFKFEIILQLVCSIYECSCFRVSIYIYATFI